MGLTLKVICRGLGLLPELMPKKLCPPISSFAMVDLSVSLPAVGKPRRCLYSASALKVFSVFLILFSPGYLFSCLRRSKSMIAFCASSGVLPI